MGHTFSKLILQCSDNLQSPPNYVPSHSTSCPKVTGCFSKNVTLKILLHGKLRVPDTSGHTDDFNATLKSHTL